MKDAPRTQNAYTGRHRRLQKPLEAELQVRPRLSNTALRISNITRAGYFLQVQITFSEMKHGDLALIVSRYTCGNASSG